MKSKLLATCLLIGAAAVLSPVEIGFSSSIRNWRASVDPAVLLLRPAVSSPASRARSYWVQLDRTTQAADARMTRLSLAMDATLTPTAPPA